MRKSNVGESNIKRLARTTKEKERKKQCRKFSEEEGIQIRLLIINNSITPSFQPFMNFQAVVRTLARVCTLFLRARASFLTFAARLLKKREKRAEKGQDGWMDGRARVRGKKTNTRRASETPLAAMENGQEYKKEISREMAEGRRCWPCAFYGVFNVGGS